VHLKARLSIDFICRKNSIACCINGKFKELTDFKGYQKVLQWAGKDVHWYIEFLYIPSFFDCQVFEFNPLTTAKLRKS
jgi:hypothetical protein